MTWKAAALILGAACAVTATIAVRHLREQPPPPEPPVRLSLEPPPDAEFGSVVEDGFDAAIAPDGRDIVFVAISRGVVQLWRRNLDVRAKPLAGTERAMLPAWSSDGASILFFADRKLKSLKLADGAISALADCPAPAGAAALSDGSIVFAPAASGPLKRLHADEISDVTRLQPGDVAHAFPARVPDTAAFMYLATREDGRRLLRLAREAGDVDLTRTDSHGVAASGYVLHLRESTLVAKRFDLETQRLADPTVTLAFDVGAHGGRGFFAAGERLLAWQTSGRRPRELRWFDLEGHDMSQVGEPADYWQVSLSPDERHAAVTMVDPLLRTPFVSGARKQARSRLRLSARRSTTSTDVSRQAAVGLRMPPTSRGTTTCTSTGCPSGAATGLRDAGFGCRRLAAPSRNGAAMADRFSFSAGATSCEPPSARVAASWPSKRQHDCSPSAIFVISSCRGLGLGSWQSRP